MFDFSWSEILLIGVVALVVIGPKDLPRVLRTVGQWTGRARAIAREFQFQLDEMVRNSELDEVRKTMNAATSGDIDKTIRDMVDPTGEIEKSVSTSEMLGETPTMPIATPPATSPSEEPEQTQASLPAAPPALPTIEGPVPSVLQTVLGSRPTAEPSPLEPEEQQTEPAPRHEAKSGTHG